MNGFIKIIISLEDGITQTVKHETKTQQCWFLLALLAPLVTSVGIKGISGRGVERAGIGYIDNIFWFRSIL